MCLVARATCHFQIGNFDQAIGDADKAISVDNKCAKVGDCSATQCHIITVYTSTYDC